MTKEEIWEKLATEVKLRGFSPQTFHTYKCNINAFLDWAGKPYEKLDEEIKKTNEFLNRLKELQKNLD